MRCTCIVLSLMRKRTAFDARRKSARKIFVVSPEEGSSTPCRLSAMYPRYLTASLTFFSRSAGCWPIIPLVSSPLAGR